MAHNRPPPIDCHADAAEQDDGPRMDLGSLWCWRLAGTKTTNHQERWVFYQRLRLSSRKRGNQTTVDPVVTGMKRKVIPVVFVAATVGLIWAAIAGLETAPAARDEATAVIMRAPDGFDVEGMGEIGIAAAAAELAARSGDRQGVEFTDGGDRIILLVDRGADRVVELRASRTGTIVERIWPGSVEERLVWASEHGRLDAPELEPATGKNLYH